MKIISKITSDLLMNFIFSCCMLLVGPVLIITYPLALLFNWSEMYEGKGSIQRDINALINMTLRSLLFPVRIPWIICTSIKYKHKECIL